jgi:hypothetical protein
MENGLRSCFGGGQSCDSGSAASPNSKFKKTKAYRYKLDRCYIIPQPLVTLHPKKIIIKLKTNH